MPTTGLQKTIHQRNKSSPALSSLVQPGGLKAAAKRTAFGDVSNTSNLARPSKDDSLIGAKARYADPEKSVALQQDKKSAALLRPAQRPLSVTGLRNLLNNVTNTSSQAAIKPPLADIQESAHPAIQFANTRKTLTKRNTTVFKDFLRAQPTKPYTDISKPASTAIPTASEESVRAEQEEIGNKELEPQNQVRRSKSRLQVEVEEGVIAAAAPESSEEAAAVRPNGIYLDKNGEIQTYHHLTDHDQERDLKAIPQGNGVHLDDSKPQHHDISSDQVVEVHEKSHQPEMAHKHRLTSVSEPEEYWDEEEEEENYDEDGYVTARSYKSRGENTMSGATTILFPKVNQKVKRELAAAKELMESVKTGEDLNDESWDTTMVAEYSEEIFQYMKELEVGGMVTTSTEKWLILQRRSGCYQILTTWTTKRRFNGQCGPS